MRRAHPMGALVRATSSSSTRRAAPESIDSAASATPVRELLGLAGDEQRGAAVQQHDVAQRAAGAGRAASRISAALCCGLAAAQSSSARARQPGILGHHLESLDPAVLERGDVDDAGGGQLVEAVAMHDPGALGAEPAQHLGHRPDPFGANTPTSWRRAPAGFDSGPSRLKIVRVPSSTRVGATWRVAL